MIDQTSSKSGSLLLRYVSCLGLPQREIKSGEIWSIEHMGYDPMYVV